MKKKILYFAAFALLAIGCNQSASDKNTSDNKNDKKEVAAKKNNKVNKNKKKPAKLVELKGNTNYAISKINNTKVKPGDVVTIDTDEFVITGWAYDRRTEKNGSGVIIKIGNKEFKARYGIERKTVAQRFNNRNITNCGFAKKIKTASLSKGMHDVEIKTITTDGRRYYNNPKKNIKVNIK